MGTEKQQNLDFEYLYEDILVKLNNPLMGTENNRRYRRTFLYIVLQG